MQGSCKNLMYGIIVLCGCISVITAAPEVLYYYEMIMHNQFLRILEILAKAFCHYANIILFLLWQLWHNTNNNIAAFRKRTLILLLFFTIIVITITQTNFCCQFIPVCV